MEDVTEYEFALKYFYNWDHWLAVTSSRLLGGEIDKWRAELSLKLQARAAKALIEIAAKPDARNISASKFVVNRGWLTQDELDNLSKKDKQDMEDSLRAKVGEDKVRMFRRE